MNRIVSESSTAAVAERLILTREALGYKPSQLSRITGLSPSALSNYESGSILISVRSANLYRAKFGVTLDWIYHGDLRALPHDFVVRLQGRVKTPQRRKRA